ncbi:MAG: hypothetical protein P1V97_32665 [Planctomycetota bacterium]|nr:hypothetical protein [Planctomycetota bacterium]
MRSVFIALSFALVACTTTKPRPKTRQKTVSVASVDKPKTLQPKVKIERDKKSPDLVEYKQYFPYSNGRRWEWDVLWLENGIPRTKSLVKESVVGIRKLNNKKDYFRIFFSNQDPKSKDEPTRTESYKRFGEDGLYVRNSELANDVLKIPFPIKMGMTWMIKDKQSVSSFKVDSFETIKLNSREYENCLKILRVTQHSNPNLSTKTMTYYAKGVGLVLEISEYPNINYVQRLELR